MVHPALGQGWPLTAADPWGSLACVHNRVQCPCAPGGKQICASEPPLRWDIQSLSTSHHPPKGTQDHVRMGFAWLTRTGQQSLEGTSKGPGRDAPFA